MGQYIEKTTCVEKDSRNITGIIIYKTTKANICKQCISKDVIVQVNLARRQGVAVSTETKYGAGGNTQVLRLSGSL